MRTNLRRFAVATVLAACLPLAAATTAHAGTGATSVHFHLVTPAAGVRFLGERRIPGGDYTATWRLFGETIRVAGPSGSTVLVPRPGSGRASVTVRPPAAAYKGSLAALAAAYARSGRSVAQDARAVGYPAAQAGRLARQAAGRTAIGYSPGQIIETPCASVSGDNGNAYGRACDIQRMVQDNGGGNWIVGDEVTGSGNDNGGFFGNDLENLTAYVNYGANNSIIQWTPNSTVYADCSPVSLGTTYNGVSLSDTATICPNSMDPYGTNTRNKFGSSWNGCDTGDGVEGVNSVDVDNNPADASVATGLTVSITWSFCI